MRDNDGDLVASAAALDSEVSIDGGAFTDCTNEATDEGGGLYSLDLTSGEMNGDAVCVITKTTTTDAKTIASVLYPQEADDIKVSVTHWLGTAAATPTVAGVPEVDVTHWLGTAAATPTVAGVPEVDVTHFNGTAGTFAGGRPEVNTSHFGGTAGTFASGRPEVNASHWAGSAVNALIGGKVQATLSIVNATADSGSSSTTVVDAERTEADADYWKGAWILFTSGPAVGQVRLITAFDQTTDTITFAPATTAAIAAGNTYQIIPAGAVDLRLWNGSPPNNLISSRVDANAQVVGDKTGYALTSGERDSVASALLDLANGVESGFTLRQSLRLMAAVLCGKASGGPGSSVFRNMADSADRVSATADSSGNRSAMSLTP